MVPGVRPFAAKKLLELQLLRMDYSSGMDSIDDYPNISNIADIDRDIESLIDSD